MGGEMISRPCRILITDDERDVVEMLAFSLGGRGYEIARAYDGLEAWERVKMELMLRIEKLLNRRQAFASLKSELIFLQRQTREHEERVCKIIHDLNPPWFP